MTGTQFKNRIRDNWIDFGYYFTSVLTFGLCIIISAELYTFYKSGKDLFLIILAIVPCVLFGHAVYILWFVPKTHTIQTVTTGKTISENKELIRAVMALYNAERLIEEDNFFSFYIQVRKPDWVNYILIMNNYAHVFVLASDSVIEINVQPKSGRNMKQPAGNIKMAERIRGEIADSIKAESAGQV